MHMDDEKIEQAIRYSHDVGFDEGYEVGYEDGYADGMAQAITMTAPTGAVTFTGDDK